MPLNSEQQSRPRRWRAKGPMAAFIADFEQLKQMVNNMQVTGGGCAKMHPDRIEIQIYRSFWPFLSFWYKQTGTTGNQITVKAGTFRVHGSFKTEVAETPLSLSGTTEYIYLQWTRSGSGVSVEHASTEPESTNTTLYVPLYRFGLSNYTTGNYVLKQIYHVGDVNLDLPLR